MLPRRPPEKLVRGPPTPEALDDGLCGRRDEAAAEALELLGVPEFGWLGE